MRPQENVKLRDTSGCVVQDVILQVLILGIGLFSYEKWYFLI